MNLEYMCITSLILSFIIGLFFGVTTVKFFSSEIISKLENAFNSQLKVNQKYAGQAIDILTEKIDEKINFIEHINNTLQRTEGLLLENQTEVVILNNQCNVRKNLESEIIKLKKIIERLERKG